MKICRALCASEITNKPKNVKSWEESTKGNLLEKRPVEKKKTIGKCSLA